jgi:hypothetical protein
LNGEASPSCPLAEHELLDAYYIENRTRLLEVAAFLDRVDRARSRGSADFRMAAFDRALRVLAGGGRDRAGRIQLPLSDRTDEPLPELDGRSACGAPRPDAGEGQA